ncbi:histone-lysine N-methyltransferase SMYD3 [Trichonephila clavipes]|nr:histone-lysine N-methyltransferase SMYD3 [Trichonephila clavipes]
MVGGKYGMKRLKANTLQQLLARFRREHYGLGNVFLKFSVFIHHCGKHDGSIEVEKLELRRSAGKDCHGLEEKAWKTHKTECKFIKKAKPKEPTASLRLVSLIILKVKKNGQEQPVEEVYGRKVCFKTLMSHAEEIKQNGKTCQQMIAMIGTIKDYIGPANIPTPSDFIEIFGKVCINTFSICDNEMQSIGSGIYLGASLFDHSCSPDAEVVFYGTNLHIHAVKHIPHRDISKIYISYIEQLQLTKDRQNALREQYYFLCQCKNCTSSEYNEMMTKLLVSEKEAEQHLGKFKTAIEHIKQMEKNKAGPSSIYSACVQELISQEKILADTHIYRVKILELAFTACVFNNQWTDAHAMGIQLLKPYRMFYGPYHPTLGIHLFKIGKIQRLLGISSWIVTLQEVETILQVTHGKLTLCIEVL